MGRVCVCVSVYAWIDCRTLERKFSRPGTHLTVSIFYCEAQTQLLGYFE
jgi:hypothetical protein